MEIAASHLDFAGLAVTAPHVHTTGSGVEFIWAGVRRGRTVTAGEEECQEKAVELHGRITYNCLLQFDKRKMTAQGCIGWHYSTSPAMSTDNEYQRLYTVIPYRFRKPSVMGSIPIVGSSIARVYRS